MGKIIEAFKNPSELTTIEMQVAFYIGIVIGLIGVWVVVVFITNFEWYWKVLTTISDIGMLGLQYFAIKQLLQARKNYLSVQEEIKKEANYIG